MYRIACPVILCLALLAPAAGAELCDDISTIADGWNAVANALEETSGEDVGDLDVERLESDVNTLLDPTQTMGEALVEVGNADEVEMGNELLEVVAELHQVDGNDLAVYMVDVIDALVDTMDDIVAYCDAVNQ